MEPARGKSCPSAQRRDPATSEEDSSSSPDHISFHISTTEQLLDQNGDLPGRYNPARCGNPSPNGWLLIGLGSSSQRAVRVAPPDNVEVPPHPGRIGYHLWIRNPSKYIQQPEDENADPPGRYRPAQCEKLNPTGWLLIGWGSCGQRAARVAHRHNVEAPPHPRRKSSHT